MKVKEIMSRAYMIDKSGRVSDALDTMEKYHVRRLIVKHGEQVQGIISLRSICGELGSRRKYNHPPSLFHAADAVSNNFTTIGPEEDMSKAIQMLKGTDCIVVVDKEVIGQVTPSDIIRHVTPDGNVGSIMKIPIIAPPDARVTFIRKLMMEKGVSRVPILDGYTLVGIISESDIAKAMRGVKRHSPQNRQDNNVKLMIANDIMTVSVTTAHPDMLIKDAAKLMIEKDIGALPVVNDQQRVVGMVTRRDIVKAI